MHGLGDGAVVLDAEVADAGGPDEILRVQQLGVGAEHREEPALLVEPLEHEPDRDGPRLRHLGILAETDERASFAVPS